MKHFIFFHGIGIRSFFWGPITPLLDEKNIHYSLIDLDFTSMEAAFNSALNGVKNIMEKYPDREIVMVGHSLGGLFAGYVAYQLGVKIDISLRFFVHKNGQKCHFTPNFEFVQRFQKKLTGIFGGKCFLRLSKPCFLTYLKFRKILRVIFEIEFLRF